MLYQSVFFLLLSTRTRPSWMICLNISFTEQPARPEDAQAHAHAHDETQAQAQDETQEEW